MVPYQQVAMTLASIVGLYVFVLMHNMYDTKTRNSPQLNDVRYGTGQGISGIKATEGKNRYFILQFQVVRFD